MTPEWEQFCRDVSAWIDPVDLNRWADAVTTPSFNPRVTLLKTSQSVGISSRFGRALKLLDAFRNNNGEHEAVTWNIVVGAVKYLCWYGTNLTEDQVVEKFCERNLKPHREFVDQGIPDQTWQINDFFLNPVASSRNPEELQAVVRSLSGNGGADDSVAEAREWLRKNPNPSALATNRFQTTAVAIEFVEALYAAGATRVVADNINEDSAAGTYSDSLTVHLPKAKAKRTKIFQVINELGRPETDGGPVEDEGEDTVGLWWD
jgi:hypothetical protein